MHTYIYIYLQISLRRLSAGGPQHFIHMYMHIYIYAYIYFILCRYVFGAAEAGVAQHFMHMYIYIYLHACRYIVSTLYLCICIVVHVKIICFLIFFCQVCLQRSGGGCCAALYACPYVVIYTCISICVRACIYRYVFGAAEAGIAQHCI